jgi:hypothetical protein
VACPDVQDLSGVRTRREDRVIRALAGVAKRGALLGAAVHLTDERIDVNDETVVGGTGARLPGTGERRSFFATHRIDGPSRPVDRGLDAVVIGRDEHRNPWPCELSCLRACQARQVHHRYPGVSVARRCTRTIVLRAAPRWAALVGGVLGEWARSGREQVWPGRGVGLDGRSRVDRRHVGVWRDLAHESR